MLDECECEFVVYCDVWVVFVMMVVVFGMLLVVMGDWFVKCDVVFVV